MERVITCKTATCHKSFKVVSPGKRSDYTDVPDVDANAICPFCRSSHRIRWPEGVRFITVPNT